MCARVARASLKELGVPAESRLAEEFLAETLGLILDRPDHLDLKITNAALKEMRSAFRTFAPYRDIPKVTMFGSARTRRMIRCTRRRATWRKALAGRGWMVVTGAGPGIMAAGMEGGGPRHVVRRHDPPAVRERAQPRDRRRPEARVDEVLLHAQADADQGVEGVPAASPAGSARSTRRSSCSRWYRPESPRRRRS